MNVSPTSGSVVEKLPTVAPAGWFSTAPTTTTRSTAPPKALQPSSPAEKEPLLNNSEPDALALRERSVTTSELRDHSGRTKL